MNNARHCTADASANGTAQKVFGKRSEAELASPTVSGSGSESEEQSHIKLSRKRQKEDSNQSDGGHDSIADTHQPSDYGDSEPVSSNEPNKASFSTKSDMPARGSEPGSNNSCSWSRTSGQNAPSSSACGQKTPKMTESIEFEKLCLAYRPSSNTSQNFGFSFDMSQQGPLPRDLDVSKTQTGSIITPATFSEVALTRDSRSLPNEPLVQFGLPKHESAAAENASAATDSSSSNLVHKEPSGSSQVSSSGHHSDANHPMDWTKLKTSYSDTRVDIQSPEVQDRAHHAEVPSTATFVSEFFKDYNPYQFSPSVPLSASQPRPPPGISHFCKCCAPHR